MAEVLAVLQTWAPYIWTSESIFGILMCVRLWSVVRARRDLEAARGNPNVSSVLTYFSRLAISVSFVFTALALIGIGSVIRTEDTPLILVQYISIATLVVLLAMPIAMLWIVFAAFRLR